MACNPAHPPREPLSGQDVPSFAYTTFSRRLPAIVTKIIDDVYRTYHALDPNEPSTGDKVKEAKNIIETIAGLRYEMQRDKPFRPLTDNDPDVKEWNTNLAKYYPASSWFKASWLFAECYLYRRVREAFALSTHWQDYDPFLEQKHSVFKSSQKAVLAIATRLMASVSSGDSDDATNHRSALDVLVQGGRTSAETREAFLEMAEMCLWGNATDLSLLVETDTARLEHLQKRMIGGGSSSKSSTSNSQQESPICTHKMPEQKTPGAIAVDKETLEDFGTSDKILANDLDKLWDRLQHIDQGRVDIILDNAGFELYVDLVFADFLVRAGFASKVVFHCKSIPWFVSDVTVADFHWTLDQLVKTADDAFFKPEDPLEQAAIQELGHRWKAYVAQSTWSIQENPFWTSCFAFWHLPIEPSAKPLFEEMKKADLWVFKGDLNYRKLVYDCKWPTTTPFLDAIGPLASKDQELNMPSLVSFRTCKADVVVGLAPGVAEQVEAKSPDWMVSGEYAVISFSGGSRV
ncbi:hypothetical protein BGZ73_005318 [Actinomortierella ambigua]|nr:hypothetical protein BGZ73_005318 [Actinomortierella ambigua]